MRQFIWHVAILTLLALALICPASCAPVIAPDRAVMHLDDLGLYDVGYAFRGGPEVPMPIGWTSGLDSPTGAACQSAGTQNGEEAWLLHCPWKGRTGVSFQDFTFRLPHVARITLSGATALRADAVGKSDGATFRVFVDGRKLLEVNRKGSAWKPFAFDLTPDAGRIVTIRFETDPGPQNNPSFDFSLWGDRTLTLIGFQPAVTHHPTPLAPDLRRLTSRQNGSVVPLAGFAETDTRQFSPTQARFRCQGADGTLEYIWEPGRSPSPLLGRVTLRARMTGDQAYTVPLASQVALNWVSPATLTHSVLHGATLTETYSVAGQTATVTVTASLHQKSLVFEIGCDKPLLSGLNGGDWGPTLRRREINLPYSSLPIWYLSQEDLFAGAFLDWTASHASDLRGTQADYQPLTDGTRNRLQERLIYTAAWNLDETLPNLPNPPSPYRAELSKRIVLDIWGETFPSIQAHLHALSDEGIGPAVALIHSWQFGGYDNMLPQTVPANAALGGNAAMKALVQEGKRDKIRMALHENYVDYYPNYPGFTTTDIARQSNGKRVLAWFNPGTKIQAFAVKPTRILPLAHEYSPQIVQRYGTNACYLDVHSAVPPWFHVDFQAGQPLAGQFRAVWDAHRALWAYERQLHQGPVFGEGNNHWYWSGYLDGVEAQFEQGWPSGAGTSAPLLPDFDLLKIHPLQLNHGMGYYERWWNHGPSAQRGLLGFLDQYRMQEAVYGHEGFLGDNAWHDPALAWLEAHLMTPLTARTALASPVAIAYQVDGHWLNTTAAAKAGSNWSRVRIRYANGVTLWANGSAKAMTVGTAVLPQYGWLATGAGMQAGTSLRDGIPSDRAETPDSVFVNARPATDWQTPGQTRIQPTVAQFTALGPRSFRATYRWAVGQTLHGNDQCFVHFVSLTGAGSNENIVFQQDHPLPLPTSRWKPGQTIMDGPWTITVPSTVAPGDYRWTIGLFQTGGGRLTLQGQSDPDQRIILGTLHVTASGVSFTPNPPAPPNTAPVNLHDRVLDFGDIRTNGSVFLRRVGSEWTLRPFPRNRPFTVWLSAARFGAPPHAKIISHWWRLPLTGAALYRWPAFPSHTKQYSRSKLCFMRSPCTIKTSPCFVGRNCQSPEDQD